MPPLLPTEIYQLIINNAPRQNLPSLSLVCRKFRDIAQEQLFRDIKISRNASEAIEQLEGLAAAAATTTSTNTSTSTASRLVSSIRSIDVDLYALTEERERILAIGGALSDRLMRAAQEVALTTARLALCLGPVFAGCSSKLESVTVRFDYHPTDDEGRSSLFKPSSASLIVSILWTYTFPSLRELRFISADTTVFWPFHRRPPGSGSWRLFPPATLCGNLGRVERLCIGNCVESDNSGNLRTDGWNFFEFVMPLFTSLRSLEICDNDNFWLPLKHYAGPASANLRRLYIRQCTVDSLPSLINNSPQLTNVWFEEVYLGQGHDRWSAVFDALSKCSFEKIFLNNLMYGIVDYNDDDYNPAWNACNRTDFNNKGKSKLCILCTPFMRDHIGFIALCSSLLDTSAVDCTKFEGALCGEGRWDDKDVCRCLE